MTDSIFVSGHLIFYNLVVLTEISSLYTQQDSDNPSLKRDSDELYFKENVPLMHKLLD